MHSVLLLALVQHLPYLVENAAPEEFRGVVWVPAPQLPSVVTTDFEPKHAAELPSQQVGDRLAVYLALKPGEKRTIKVHTGSDDQMRRLKARYPAVCDSRLLDAAAATWESDLVGYQWSEGKIVVLGKPSNRWSQPAGQAVSLTAASPEVTAAGPVAAGIRAGKVTCLITRNSRWTEVETIGEQRIALPARDGEKMLIGDRWLATFAGELGLALYAEAEYCQGIRNRELVLKPDRSGRVRYRFAAYWAGEHQENVVEQEEGDVPLPRVGSMERYGTTGRILLRPPRMESVETFEQRLRRDLVHLANPPRVTKLPPESKELAAGRPKSYDEALKLMFQRIRTLAGESGGRFWFSSDANGVASFKGPEPTWGDGYYVSILWDAWRFTGDDWYRTAALAANRRMLGQEEREAHATGLNFWNASARSYAETRDGQWRRSGLRCADVMVHITDPATGFIPEYGPTGRKRLDDPYDALNYSKIDALVGLPILWWAYDQTKDKHYLDIANRHMSATIDTLIEPDGAALQQLWHDPRTGRILGVATSQGYGGSTRWARGLAWVLDGFPDAYRTTRIERYRATFARSARWLEQNLPPDLISWYDFDDQGIFWDYRDSSTSAISAYGLLRMSELEPDPKLAAHYRDFGIRIVNALIDRALTPVGDADPRPPGMLAQATYTKPNEGEFIWGNYSLVRSLCWLREKGITR